MTTRAARLAVEAAVVAQGEIDGEVEGEMGASKLGGAEAEARWKGAVAVEGHRWGVGRGRRTPPAGGRRAARREDGASSGGEEGATRIDHRAVRGKGSGPEKEAAVRRVNSHALKRSFRATIGGVKGISVGDADAQLAPFYGRCCEGGVENTVPSHAVACSRFAYYLLCL